MPKTTESANTLALILIKASINKIGDGGSSLKPSLFKSKKSNLTKFKILVKSKNHTNVRTGCLTSETRVTFI